MYVTLKHRQHIYVCVFKDYYYYGKKKTTEQSTFDGQQQQQQGGTRSMLFSFQKKNKSISILSTFHTSDCNQITHVDFMCYQNGNQKKKKKKKKLLTKLYFPSFFLYLSLLSKFPNTHTYTHSHIWQIWIDNNTKNKTTIFFSF